MAEADQTAGADVPGVGGEDRALRGGAGQDAVPVETVAAEPVDPTPLPDDTQQTAEAAVPGDGGADRIARGETGQVETGEDLASGISTEEQAPIAANETPQAPAPEPLTDVAAGPAPSAVTPEPVTGVGVIDRVEPRDPGSDLAGFDNPVLVAPAVEKDTNVITLDAGDPAVPVLDLVRIETDGAAVIAGRALPDSLVRIRSDGTTIAEVRTSRSGEFVAFADADITKSTQTIDLIASLDGGPYVRSTDSVIVLGQAVEEIKGPPPEDQGAEPVAVAAVAEEIEEEASPAILSQSADGDLRVLQPSSLATVDQITLDSISYDETGEAVLSGRGRADMRAWVYVDGTRIADVAISPSGTWDATLAGLDAGRYILRIDEVDGTGKVASRVESPFQRVYPTAERLALLQSDNEVIVQPGNNLWNIAKRRYGEGMKYWVIYRANENLIRDPDLIYPGQIFDLPTEN